MVGKDLGKVISTCSDPRKWIADQKLQQLRKQQAAVAQAQFERRQQAKKLVKTAAKYEIPFWSTKVFLTPSHNPILS